VYLTAKEICTYVKKTNKTNCTVKGMTSLLHQLGFQYKKPTHVLGKANIEIQLVFIRKYIRTKCLKMQEDRIYFMDGVHSLHNSQLAFEWIKKGAEMALKSITSRQ